MRRFFAFLGLLLLALGLWFFWPRADQHKFPTTGTAQEKGAVISPMVTPASATSAAATASAAPRVNSDATNSTEARITLADDLNAPTGDVHRDLMILQDIFIAWRSNYPHEGNPVGENNEITAALTGKNSLQLALIPANHPAINADGELCDRWGTPFIFHQLSGERMEIRSAGPDRKLYTPDDAVLTP